MIFTGLRKLRNNKTIKICSILIGLTFIVELGLILYSNCNIVSKDLNTEVTVMSYNLFFKNSSKSQSISIIKKDNPDILFVQELTPLWASELDKSLSKLYKYKLTIPLKRTHGLGIYSKHKISNQHILRNTAKKPFAQIVDLTIKNKTVQLINAHLASPAIAIENKGKFFPLFLQNYKIRKQQISQLNTYSKAKETRYDSQILVGDLNTLHSEPIFKRLKLNWVNSNYSILRWMKFNFPHSSKIPTIMTLDYTLARGKVDFLDSKVIKGGSSDHLAISTKLKI